MNDVLVPKASHRRDRKDRIKKLFWYAAGSCALGGLYAGRINRDWLRTTRLDMPLRGLGAGFDGARIIHISDLHCSPIVLGRYLRQCVEMVNQERPDFVAITGDFVTGGTAYARRVAKILAHVSPAVATLACLGNHDHGIMHPHGHGHMRQLPNYLTRHLAEAGVYVLRNEHEIFVRGGSTLQFVGVDDFWSPSYKPRAAFALAHRDMPTVCLSHNPDSAHDVLALGAQWVLSGHTHGRAKGDSRIRDAMFPIAHEHFVGGYYAVDDGHVYVNRGLSYARRVNINRRPEITVLTLRQA